MRLVKFFALMCVAVFALSQTADAALRLTIDDASTVGVDFDITDEGGLDDASGTVGLVSSGIVTTADFVVQLTVGTSKPIIGSSTVAALDTFNLSISGLSAGTLTIMLTDTDYVLVPGSGVAQVKSEIGGTTSGTGVSFETFVDFGNTEFGTTTPLHSFFGLGPGGFGGNAGGSQIYSTPFSMTHKVVIVHNNGGDITSLDGFSSLTVPEPSTIAVWSIGAGLLGLVAVRRRRG